MFRFENPEYLYLLITIPILLLLFIFVRIQRRYRLKKLADIKLLPTLIPDVSAWRPWVKFILCITALTSLIIMVARPQVGLKLDTDKRNGIEMIVALDVSNSMLATDVSPNRLEKAKMLLTTISDKLNNNKIGLIVFAGDAYVQLPITSDGVSAQMFLDEISTGMVPTQGTNITEALRLAKNSFTEQKNVERAIILITDGEEHEGQPEDIAADIAKSGIHVFVLGIGNTKGSPIALRGSEYMRDNQGNVVITKLNAEMCQKIAIAGKGEYIHVDNSNIAGDRLYYELNKLEKTQLSSAVYSEYDEQFMIFAIVALLLLIIDVCMLDKKNIKLSNKLKKIININRKTSVVIIFMLMSSTIYGQSQDKLLMQKGNNAFKKNDYQLAETNYRKALEVNSGNARARYNLGNALLSQKKPKEAMQEYEKAAVIEKNPLYKAAIYHNMGIILQSQKQYAQAIDCYKESLRNNHKDDETRYNLALCQFMNKKNNGNNNKNNNQDNKNKDQNKEKNKEDKQKQNKQQDKQSQDDQQKISKDNAEQMLQAAQMEEKRTQDKVKRAKARPNRMKYEKNW